MLRSTLAAICILLLGRCAFSQIFDIPRVENITIDGKLDDWHDDGFRVDIMPGDDGTLRPAAEFNSTFRLAWDDRGLLVLARATDDTPVDPPADELWRGDGIELYLARHKGSDDFFQAMLSAPRRLKERKIREQIVDLRKTESLRSKPLKIEAASKTSDNDYIIETLLPWENLGVTPRPGEELAFQIYFDDGAGGVRQLLRTKWFPELGAHEDSSRMHRIRLADKPSPGVRAAATASYAEFRRTRVTLAAAPQYLGKRAMVCKDDHTYGPFTLTDINGYASAIASLPLPARDQPAGAIDVTIDDQPAAHLELPNADEQRAKAFIEVPLKFDAIPVSRFPQFDFEEPALVEDLIGPYRLHTTYYDNNHNPATHPTRVGRYGAVIDIDAADGRHYRRFRTIFATTQPNPYWRDPARATFELPAVFHIDPAVQHDNAQCLGDALKISFYDNLTRPPLAAGILAALSEMKSTGHAATVFDDAAANDRQWWVDQKRKLYNFPPPAADKIGPFSIEGAPAPILREGSLEAAGMKPDASSKIDALLNEWSNHSDQAFAV